jgi:hypothetical protein
MCYHLSQLDLCATLNEKEASGVMADKGTARITLSLLLPAYCATVILGCGLADDLLGRSAAPPLEPSPVATVAATQTATATATATAASAAPSGATPIPTTEDLPRVGSITFWKGHKKGDQIESEFPADWFLTDTDYILAEFALENIGDHDRVELRWYYNGELWNEVSVPIQLVDPADRIPLTVRCYPPCVEAGTYELQIWLGSRLLGQKSFEVR